MLLTISIFEQIFDTTAPILFIELIGAAFAIFGFITFFKHNNVKSQLAAKDAVIQTNQQTIDAFEERLDSLDVKVKDLEAKLDEADTKNKSLVSELRDWEQRYKSLENFAAPQLGEKLIKMFEHQEIVLDKIVSLLDEIEKRMDAIEGATSRK